MAASSASFGQRLSHLAFVERKHMRQRFGALFVPACEKRALMVAGVQRSGTNMLMHILERSDETDVFLESDHRAFHKYEMRSPPAIRHLIEKSCAPRVVFKALYEGDKLRNLLDAFAPASAIWMVRDHNDVVNSSLRRWPGDRNHIEKILIDRNAAGWRGRGMSDATHALLREYYQPNVNDASAQALFWYYRHQLLFDQKLEEDPRVLVLRYEPLVQCPEEYGKIVARFTGIAYTADMVRTIFNHSVGKRPPPPIVPRINALCEGMLSRLIQVSQRVPTSPTVPTPQTH